MAESESRHVIRTLRALELLADGPRTPTELASALDVHPRTARRLLDRLVAEEYATGAGRRHYTATPKMLALARPVVERSDLARVAPPYVMRLRDETQEAAHVSLPGRNGVMHLLYEHGERVVMVKGRLGEFFPYHSTAFGKALLAHLPAKCSELVEAGLERYTENTLTDPADLLLELAAVRERGFAVDNLENDLDLRCVAAPVFDRGEEAVGALGISAPAGRLAPNRFGDVGGSVVALANGLSATLGSVRQRRSPSADPVDRRQPVLTAGR